MDSKKNTPLHLAAEKNNRGLIRLMLDHNAAAGVKNKLGFVPADLLAGKENDDLVRKLEEQAETSGKK